MPSLIRIHLDNNDELPKELELAIKETDIDIVSIDQSHRGAIAFVDIVVALGSAGAFTALYQIICKLMEKDKDRELTIESDKKKVTLKGFKLPEAKELLKMLAPEVLAGSNS